MRLICLAALAACSGALTATAQEASAPCSAPAFQQFDFWLGTWQVRTPDGALAGENIITREEQGCLILERWTSINGGTGQSYNFYNPATENWRQVWVSSGAMIDYEGGLTEAGSIKLSGVITYVASGQIADFTGEWTPNDDGSVTQHFEQYDPETEAWTTWFTGHYVKSGEETVSQD